MRIRTKVFGSLEHIVCYSLLACVMTLTLSSCSAATQETHVVSEAKTVSELRAPYASSDAYEFASDPIVVDQDGAITFKTDYDTNFTGDGFSSWEVKFKDYGLDSPFVLYADADLSVIEQIYDGSSIKEGGALPSPPTAFTRLAQI